MNPEFRYETYIFTTPQLVFEALTSDEIQARFMNNTGARSTWQVGDKVLWKSDPNGEYEDLDQEVLEVIPDEKLSYTWHRLQDFHRDLFDSEAALKVAQQEQSRVTWLIEDASVYHMGTKVTLVHDGFDSAESEMLKGVSMGWTMIIAAMKTYLETGTGLRPEPTA
ncbi:SRPBCC domain-containing protein [Corynebacterium epidermidicanis]|nr:SRPBCC domain-containing protein [Corynebacterium epidermidicanis]